MAHLSNIPHKNVLLLGACYEFPDKELGKVCSYGVYDMTRNQGWVSVGTDHDTAQFAVESLGLIIQATLHKGTYPTGIKVTDQQVQELNLYPAAFHGQDWNYSIQPR